jgi:hypothetical protein
MFTNNNLLKKEIDEGVSVLTKHQHRPRIMKLRIPAHLADGSIMGNAVNRVSTLCEQLLA